MVPGEFRMRVKLARILLPTHGLPIWITSSWQIRVEGGASRCVAGSEFMRLWRDAGGAGAQVISPMISNRFLQVHYGILWYIMVDYGILWYIMVYYGILWYIMVHYGILWYIMVYYGIA